ncbi:MAG TPA: CHASE3 domain-containing protein, partial [Segetibacter sp.]
MKPISRNKPLGFYLFRKHFLLLVLTTILLIGCALVNMVDKHFKKITKGLVTSVFILLAPTAICYYSLLKFHTSSKLVVHTQLIISLLEELISTLKDAETGVRGYLITGEDAFLDPYTYARGKATMNYSQVSNLMQDNAKQRKALVLLNKQIIVHFKTLDSLYVAKTHHQPIPIGTLRQGKVQMDRVRSTIRYMKNLEYDLLQESIAVESDYMIYTTILILTVIIIEVGLIYWFYKKLMLTFERIFSLQKTLKRNHWVMKKRIQAIQKVTFRISQGEYDIELNENDQGHLGILASSINKMSS